MIVKHPSCHECEYYNSTVSFFVCFYVSISVQNEKLAAAGRQEAGTKILLGKGRSYSEKDLCFFNFQ